MDIVQGINSIATPINVPYHRATKMSGVSTNTTKMEKRVTMKINALLSILALKDCARREYQKIVLLLTLTVKLEHATSLPENALPSIEIMELCVTTLLRVHIMTNALTVRAKERWIRATTTTRALMISV